MLTLPNFCEKKGIEIVKIPITEWKSKAELKKYKILLQQNGAPLPDEIALVKLKGSGKTKGDSDQCEDHDVEIIGYNDHLVLIDDGYPVVYTKKNPYVKLGVNCKELHPSDSEVWPPNSGSKSVCYYPHQDLLAAYETYAANAYITGIDKLRRHIVPMKNIHYGRLDEGPYGGTKYRYEWESPKKLTIFLRFPGGGIKLVFEEKNGTTSVTYLDFMRSAYPDEIDKD